MLFTNHIFIGVVYVLSGIIGGSFGITLSLVLRLELSLPGFIICSALQYNSIITFHGLLMIFFMIMPLLIGGFGNLLLPIMLCSSDMIFPRLNALSLWLIVTSLFILFLSIFCDGGVNSGWTFYVPLSTMGMSSIDLMFFSLHFAGISSLIGSINFICSIVSSSNLSILYCLFTISLFPWSIFYTSTLLIISLPVLAACITMIIYDRHFNSVFFNPFVGGDCLLFQHLFWFFGHPEVYILILPVFGLASEIITCYSQCFIFSRDSMLTALLIIGMLGCIVWGHHMFIVGFDIDTRSYFTTATSIIAIPTGIKILNWLCTIWSGCFLLISPLFFIIGFLLSFSFGGFTGLILSNCIIDILLHDSYFVIGHFHYVLSLGVVYSFFSSLFNYILFFSYDFLFYDFISRFQLVILFISSFCMFFSLHSLGILGFPRRIFDYPVIFYRINYLNSFSFIGILLFYLIFNTCF